jgi:hypothetical protein
MVIYGEFCRKCNAIADISLTFIATVTILFFFSMAFPAHSGPWPLIQFCNHFSQTVGLLGQVISSSQGRYLNTGQHRIKAYTPRTSIPRVGLESTIPSFERVRPRGYCDRQYQSCTRCLLNTLVKLLLEWQRLVAGLYYDYFWSLFWNETALVPNAPCGSRSCFLLGKVTPLCPMYIKTTFGAVLGRKCSWGQCILRPLLELSF